MEYVFIAAFTIMLLALSGYFRISYAIQMLDRLSDRAQKFILVFDAFCAKRNIDKKAMRHLALTSREIQLEIGRAFRDTETRDVKQVNIYNMFREFRAGKITKEQLVLARKNVDKFLDIVNFSQDHLRRKMLSPLAIFKETGKLFTFKPMPLYYHEDVDDPLHVDNKIAEKNIKKGIALFFVIVGMIVTAIALVKDWLAYYATILGLGQ